MAKPIRVTVWNEGVHEKTKPEVAAIYPKGLHGAVADGLQKHGFQTSCAVLDDPEHGLSHDVLTSTDVLIWWGHAAHDAVENEIVERVYERVLQGMGLIVLHSAHFSKIFRKLMGTSCDLKWREADERERLWVVAPNHPIAAGIGEYIELEQEEMYGEYFDIPVPDELVFLSWFQGGEVFRSGCCYTRGLGKIFYFRPGHEMYPTYHNAEIQKVIANAVGWAAPAGTAPLAFGNRQPLENLGGK